MRSAGDDCRACCLLGLREQAADQTIVVMRKDNVVDLVVDIYRSQFIELGITDGLVSDMVPMVMMAAVLVSLSVMSMIGMVVTNCRPDMRARASDMQMVVSMQCLPERRDEKKTDDCQPPKQYFSVQLDHALNIRKVPASWQGQGAHNAKTFMTL